jgi:endonuclease/exonuclease/phosphatase family metal-dependent hydrolase
LPAYDGFLANESPVAGGRRFYGQTEQKLGVLFKRDLVRVIDAKLILTQNNNDFAGRPPLQVRMRVSMNGRSEELVLIVLHMKATLDDASWRRRANAADALKQYLDATWPSQRVLIVGDWNDDVDQSLTRGRPSPYDNFVQDVARYRFITAALSARGVSSTASYHDMIDHHLATRALANTELRNAVEVETLDRLIPNYKRTTSDHYPVISHYVVTTTP